MDEFAGVNMSSERLSVDSGSTIPAGVRRRAGGRSRQMSRGKDKAAAGPIWSSCLVVSFVLASWCSFVTAGRDDRPATANQEPPPAAILKHQPPPDGNWTADAEVADARTFTDNALGAAQGIAVRDGKVFAYGDVYSASPRLFGSTFANSRRIWR
jgi:hypothetical protein